MQHKTYETIYTVTLLLAFLAGVIRFFWALPAQWDMVCALLNMVWISISLFWLWKFKAEYSKNLNNQTNEQLDNFERERTERS